MESLRRITVRHYRFDFAESTQSLDPVQMESDVTSHHQRPLFPNFRQDTQCVAEHRTDRRRIAYRHDRVVAHLQLLLIIAAVMNQPGAIRLLAQLELAVRNHKEGVALNQNAAWLEPYRHRSFVGGWMVGQTEFSFEIAHNLTLLRPPTKRAADG